MDVTRTLDPEKKILYITITGEMTLAGIRAEMKKVATQPGYSPAGYTPDMPGFVDLRKATARVTGDDIRQIAEAIMNLPKTKNRARRALLVDSDLMYGLYRMFSVFTSGSNIEYRIFRDEKLAQAWVEEAVEGRPHPQNPSHSPDFAKNKVFPRNFV